eukprot:5678581-Amphidinium_carterae.1
MAELAVSSPPCLAPLSSLAYGRHLPTVPCVAAVAVAVSVVFRKIPLPNLPLNTLVPPAHNHVSTVSLTRYRQYPQLWWRQC